MPARSWTPATVGGLLLLAGCCSNVTTDPRAGGLAGGVCGETTGAYRARLAAREDVLRSLDTAEARLLRDLDASRGEAAGLDRRLARQRRQAAGDRAALRSLQAEIAAAERDGRVSAARVADLEREVGRLDGELADLVTRSGERERTLRALRQGAAGASATRELETQTDREDARRERRQNDLDALRRELAAPPSS